MPRRVALNAKENRQIAELVRLYRKNIDLVRICHGALLGAIVELKAAQPYIHTIRDRIKSEESLTRKLRRKCLEAKKEGRDFGIDQENLFKVVNDLSGIRVLHLHSKQFANINDDIPAWIGKAGFTLIEGPVAKVWDNETRNFFESLKVTTNYNEQMYTSVHYVVSSNSAAVITAEIQVRTLMEEVWGEVSHSLNYPEPNASFACQEQIRSLARFTSGVSRLVDAIFATDQHASGDPKL